jgi:hypothetical protein
LANNKILTAKKAQRNKGLSTTKVNEQNGKDFRKFSTKKIRIIIAQHFAISAHEVRHCERLTSLKLQ